MGFPESVQQVFLYYSEATFRLLLACVLGGFIGFEREYTSRPAGFRTHMLVCVASALVMLTGEHIFHKFGGSGDPARLGAQVISGIGFLGVGTIIRDGINVRGLTTAASLWAVSCVGLATGIGYYWGAILTTVLISTTLVVMKRVVTPVWVMNRKRSILIESEHVDMMLSLINRVLKDNGAAVKDIEFMEEHEHESGISMARIIIKIPKGGGAKVLKAINGIAGLENTAYE